MRRISLLVVGLAVARLASAQPAAHTGPTSGVTVTGIITDSISSAPLAGAVVQLVPADGLARSARTEYSDWLGRFSFSAVPNGRYTIGFFHPMLDSLGVEAPMRALIVNGDEPVRADMSTPSPAELRAAVCGPRDRGAMVVGVVRDAADGSPLAGAAVVAEWFELSFTDKGTVSHRPRLSATTLENGWFVLCNVPREGALTLFAARAADSTDRLEIEVPSNGIVRRELYVGSSARKVATAAAVRPDTITLPPIRDRRASLSGIVVSAEGGKPVVGAEVIVSRSHRTRTNDDGEWTLRDVSPGTRMLEVRALGYSPERRAVDIAQGAPPVRVALVTVSAMLEAVKVSATARLHIADLAGFHQRRRNGAGHYLTAADIERRGDLFTSEIFRSMPGLQLGYAYDTLPAGTVTPDDVHTVNQLILMRSITGEWCAPGIYVNGLLFPGMSAGDLNTLVTTKEVAGIEVYTPASVPAQFKQMMTGCGVIAVWKK